MFGYEPADGVTRYAIQAPNDINRYYAGLQKGELGFGVAPERIPGIQILDSGMSGPVMTPMKVAENLMTPLVVAAQVPASVENHNNLMSENVAINGSALKDVRALLAVTDGR